MKKTLLVLFLIAFAAAAVSGCAKKSVSPSAVPAGGDVAASSSFSGRTSSQEASSEEEASSQPASSGPGLREPASSQNGPVIDIQTDNKEFDAKFKQNPIDRSYVKESAAAVSNIDMVNVSNKYAGVWQKEIDHAWSGLETCMKTDSSARPASLEAEQQKWENGRAAALQKIASDAQAAGGTMARVDAASQTMDFYRSRANQLYRELYSYDTDYTYAWKSN